MATKNESTAKYTCQARVYSGKGGFWTRPCGRDGKHVHEGAHYCKTHHPPTAEAKRAASHAKIVDKLHGQLSESKAAADELAAMRKDAARYREIRDHCDLIVVMRDVTKDSVSADWPIAPGWMPIETGDELDKRTDAMIASRMPQ